MFYVFLLICHPKGQEVLYNVGLSLHHFLKLFDGNKQSSLKSENRKNKRNESPNWGNYGNKKVKTQSKTTEPNFVNRMQEMKENHAGY